VDIFEASAKMFGESNGDMEKFSRFEIILQDFALVITSPSE